MAAVEEKAKKDIVDQLYWDSRVDASQVKVEVAGGIARLTGKVPTYGARQAAEEDAWAVDGVVSVDNQLLVRIPDGREAPPDGEIRQDVQKALKWNPSLDASRLNVDVRVEDGIVTLTGTVPDRASELAAYRTALYTDGVADIRNMLIIEGAG